MLTATRFDTLLCQASNSTFLCMHPTASLYNLISRLIPVSYTQMLPTTNETLTTGQNLQPCMVHTTDPTSIHTPAMTNHITSPSNLPHPMDSATNYCPHTFLQSYLYHTFLHSKDYSNQPREDTYSLPHGNQLHLILPNTAQSPTLLNK